MSQSARDLVANIRHELAAVIPVRVCCQAAELDGLRDSGRRSDVATARLVHQLSVGSSGLSGVGTPVAQANIRAVRVAAPNAPLHCMVAFLRGRLLARGSLSLTAGRAHLELVLPRGEAGAILPAFGRLGVPGHLRERRGRGVIVWKGRAKIFDLLRRVGAGSSVAEAEARDVLREVRGELNRSINAETANLQRTVRAGMRQASAIRKLEEAGALQPGVATWRVATARLQHPDATIAELGKRLRMTRSSVQRSLLTLERQAAALSRSALP